MFNHDPAGAGCVENLDGKDYKHIDDSIVQVRLWNAPGRRITTAWADFKRSLDGLAKNAPGRRMMVWPSGHGLISTTFYLRFNSDSSPIQLRFIYDSIPIHFQLKQDKKDASTSNSSASHLRFISVLFSIRLHFISDLTPSQFGWAVTEAAR